MSYMPNGVCVFVASAYTLGDTAINVRSQMEIADRLMDHDFIPISPLYSHFQHMHRPRDYDDWMELSFALLRVSDVVMRLPGVSDGADKEVAEAAILGIPVVYSIEELLSILPTLRIQ